MAATIGTAAAPAGTSPLEVPARLPLRSDDTRLMYLSVSSLALFWRCPERWRRPYLKRQREPQNGPMLVGKAVGATIAAHFAARIVGESLSATDADDLCAAEFDERLGQAGTDLREDDPDVLREQSREALRAYLTELAPSVRPVSVERRFELRFDGAEWSIVGYLDVEDESGDTIDVKVGAKHVTEARAGSDPQPRPTGWPAEPRGGLRDASCSIRSGAGRSARMSAVSSYGRSARPGSSLRGKRGSPKPRARSRAAPRAATGHCRRRTGGGARPASAGSGVAARAAAPDRERGATGSRPKRDRTPLRYARSPAHRYSPLA